MRVDKVVYFLNFALFRRPTGNLISILTFVVYSCGLWVARSHNRV